MNIIILGKRGVGKTWTAIEIQSHLHPSAVIHNDIDWKDVPKEEPISNRGEIHIYVVKAGTASEGVF